MTQIQVLAWKCERLACGHEWLAKVKPKACAKCKSRNWHSGDLAAQVKAAAGGLPESGGVINLAAVARLRESRRPAHHQSCTCTMCKPPKGTK